MPFGLILGLIVAVIIFYLPMLLILMMSIAARIPNSFALLYWPPTLANFTAVFEPIYLNLVVTTLRVIGTATLVTALLGIPLAVFIHRRDEQVKRILLFGLMLPFFANFLARIYAWFILLKPNGILEALGIGSGQLLNTEAGLVLTLVSTYLPFFVYPVYLSLDRIDGSLAESARNLGASDDHIFWRITLPLIWPGIAAGSTMVALPAIGEFLIAKMVGGGLVPIVALLVETTFLGKVTPNWPFGTAMIVLMMGLILTLLLLTQRVMRQMLGVGAAH